MRSKLHLVAIREQETLVAQDKLRVCKAQIKWVSSEKQYADGMTKSDAAQLLADRLRSHQMKLTSDTNFQAAKKKTALQRKKGEEMYAIKKPSKTLRAFAAATTFTTAHSLNYNTTDNINVPNDDSFTFTNFLLTIVFMMALAHGIHLLPQLYNLLLQLHHRFLFWLMNLNLRRRMRPILQCWNNHVTKVPALHGEGRPETPAEAAHFEAALPVERPGENGEPEDLNPIMTMWSPIWRTWLPTFESNFAWLMRIIPTTTTNCRNFCKNMNDWWGNMEQLNVSQVTTTWTVSWHFNKLRCKEISTRTSRSRFKWL